MKVISYDFNSDSISSEFTWVLNKIDSQEMLEFYYTKNLLKYLTISPKYFLITV